MKSLLSFLLVLSVSVQAQNISYPFPVQYITLKIEQQAVRMAYMDVAAVGGNGSTVLLLHGKNFNGYYWRGVIDRLRSTGFRVIVPDQVGWGRSDKPRVHYSFHQLAANTKRLLDSLSITRVHVVGHSMGGMLATRFALMYPATVEKLVLENPIGLEDYRTFVPYQPLDSQYAKELKATYASYKKYQQTYYPEWKPEYEQYVLAQAEPLGRKDFPKTAWVNALTYQMIYEQPVVYEFKNITVPTLIVMGQEDRTVVGKDLVDKNIVDRYGNYPQLGKWLQGEIKGSKLVALQQVGHIPHIQVPEVFERELLQFFRNSSGQKGGEVKGEW